MLGLISKALTGVVLDREARDAMREAGGLASAIQSSADARMIKAAMAAQGLHLVGSTPLTSPRLPLPASNGQLPLAVRIARAAMAPSPSTMAAAAANSTAAFMPALLPDFDPDPELAPMPAPTLDAADRIATSATNATLAAKMPAMPVPQSMPKPAMPKPAAPKMTGPVTAERAALIAQAMKLHSAKQSVLASLSDDQRALLTSIAMKALFPQTTGA